MKIGIITIINVNNYGAELQAFALQHKLRKMGYNAEIINYLYYKNSKYIQEKESLPIIKTSIKNKIKDTILKWIDKYSEIRYPKIAQRRKTRFSNFHKKYTALSKPYLSFSDLYKTKLNYDLYVVGSDQVWNPNNGTNISPYFLTFAPNTAKKVSYASSFGVENIDSSYFSKYKELLNNIDVLSTRESDGVNIIKQISGRNAEHVVDPTLLLTKNEWKEISVPYTSEEPYVLFFVFKKNKFAEELVYNIKKKTGFKIIRVCKNEIPLESDNKILNIRDFGPAEFLGLYDKASFVVTTSFHGSIFSLIFQKPFYTIIPSSKNNNSRQKSLMQMINLEDRLITEDSDLDLDKMYSIDYDRVHNKLKEKIKLSEDYLKNVIKEN